MAQPSPRNGYMPQLDGLRALAVLSVFACHWLGCRRVNWGNVGVMLFFVLSGFLITGILLRARRRVESGRDDARTAIARFYVRRVLRIFPLYYVTILLAAVPFKDIRDVFPWHVAYATNIYVWVHDQWPGVGTHFWSLAVEEQFYIVWPWLIVFLPARLLPPLLTACVMAAPVFRLWAIEIGHSARGADTLTPACLDALGLGALLALPALGVPAWPRLREWLIRSSVIVGLPCTLLIATLQQAGLVGWWDRLFPSVLSLAFVGVVDAAAQRSGTWWGRLLESRPLTYLGKISYGLYVFHPFIGAGLETVSRKATWLAIPSHPMARFVVFGLVTTAVASASWRYFELPVNRLKERFAPARP